MTPEERAELDLLLSQVELPGSIPFCPHLPHPKQREFLDLDCREALYGGAAGGGKSDALLMAALQYVHVPGYRALILRRTFAQMRLPGGILERSLSWFAGRPGVRWSERDKTWRFPSGASLTFGHFERRNDWQRYQGPEFQFIGFDELTQFEQPMYTYLFSRLRRLADAEVPVRMRSGSNPGGPGHEWVKSRFEPHLPAERRTYDQAKRLFVPARLEDNPSLDRDDYRESLTELGAVLRQQLLDGDWSVKASVGFFCSGWFRTWDGPLPEGVRWVRFWDAAAKAKERSDYWAGAKVTIWRGALIIANVRRFKAEYPDAKAKIKQQAALDGRETVLGIEDSSSGTPLIQDLRRDPEMRGYVLAPVPVPVGKTERAGPWASLAMDGKVWVLPGNWVGDFLDECDVFPEAGFHNDQVDAVSGGVEMFWRFPALLGRLDRAKGAAGGEDEEPRRKRRAEPGGIMPRNW